MKADRCPDPTPADDDPAWLPAAPPRSHLHELIIGCFVTLAWPTILGLLMVIFMATPVGMPPELWLDLGGSSLSSLNISISISISHSKLVSVEDTHMKLLFSSDGQLTLSPPSLVSPFTHAPRCVTSLQVKAQTTLSIVTKLVVNSVEVTIKVAERAKWRLRLGPWWVAVLDVEISCIGLTFTAPSDNEGGDDWIFLAGTLSCSLNIIPQL